MERDSSELGDSHDLRDGVVALHDGDVLHEVAHVEVGHLLSVAEELLAQALVQLHRLVKELLDRRVVVRLALIVQ